MFSSQARLSLKFFLFRSRKSLRLLRCHPMCRYFHIFYVSTSTESDCVFLKIVRWKLSQRLSKTIVTASSSSFPFLWHVLLELLSMLLIWRAQICRRINFEYLWIWKEIDASLRLLKTNFDFRSWSHLGCATEAIDDELSSEFQHIEEIKLLKIETLITLSVAATKLYTSLDYPK